MYALVRVEDKLLRVFWGTKEGLFLLGWLNVIGASPLLS